MKDIDFDELDRAVSSVLSRQAPVAKDEEVATQDEVSITESSTQSDDTSVADSTKDLDRASEAEPTSTDDNSSEVSSDSSSTQSPLAVKRRGKFMDVMHPSHDMTPNTPSPLAPKRMAVTPLSPTVAPSDHEEIVDSAAEINEEPLTDTKQESVEPIAPIPEEPEVEESTQKNSLYIDPLELAAKNDEQNSSSDETVSDEPDESAVEQSTVAVDPVTTPFLNDAQVEKRPLGAFGEVEPTPALEITPEESTPDEADELPETQTDLVETPTSASQTAPPVPLPRELQPDVVSVETIQDETEVPEATVSDASNSITEGHPLFDTSTYHEPTAAKKGKKMSGWLVWLIGFLFCLAIGGGVGYFLFTVGL